MAIGCFCGGLSSILYTATNVCLRQVAHVDSIWVSTVKAAPTLLAVAPIVLWHMLTSRRSFHGWRPIRELVATSIAVQIFGNVAFQWALSVLGLTISVPIVLATMLVGGALTGRFMLQESVGRQKMLAVSVLIIATIALSYGAHTGATSLGPDQSADTLQITLALLANVASGLAYAFLGTMMRRSMQAGMSLFATLFVLSLVGTAFLAGWSWLHVGAETIRSTATSDLLIMLAAGTLNALAFLAMAKSLQQIPVLLVQMLNASQAAISAAAGWLLFSESITNSVLLGLILTALGLLIAGIRRGSRKAQSTAPEALPTSSLAAQDTSPRYSSQSDGREANYLSS